jgi:hypothetical protein
MKEFIRIINKYVIILLISAILGKAWYYLQFLLMDNLKIGHDIGRIYSYVITWTINLLVIILLIIDFKKYELKYAVLSCFAALFFPLFGVVLFALFYMEKRISSAVE